MPKCVQCASPAVEGQVRCEFHRERARIRSASARAANPDKARECNRAAYKRKRRQRPDTCLRCARPALPDRVMCEVHLALAREDARARAAAGKTREAKQAWRRTHKEGALGFGLTRDEYERMLAGQGHRCAICGERQSAMKRHLSIDHDHRFPKGDPRGVRGILCHRCNTALGAFGDSIDGLRRALVYLEKFEATVRPRIVRVG